MGVSKHSALLVLFLLLHIRVYLPFFSAEPKGSDTPSFQCLCSGIVSARTSKCDRAGFALYNLGGTDTVVPIDYTYIESNRFLVDGGKHFEEGKPYKATLRTRSRTTLGLLP